MSHPYYGLNELREMFLSFFETQRPPASAKLLARAAERQLHPPHQRRHDADEALVQGRGGAAAPPRLHLPEVHPHGRHRERRQDRPPRHLLRDAGQLLLRRLLQARGHRLELGVPDRRSSVWRRTVCTPPSMRATTRPWNIWHDEIGIPAEKIFRFGKEDNFWEHGSGPCGPCSEIYYDRGPEYGCGKPGCTVGCDCDRYIEIWNNVFSQFDNDGHDNYTELKQKNIDTGMGLERLACVCQNVDSLFDVDTVMNITHKVSELTGAHYGESEKTRRVPARHHRPHPLRDVHDLRRHPPLERGPWLCAAPSAAPRRAPRQAPRRQRSVPVSGRRHRCPRERVPVPRPAREAELYHQGHPHRGRELRPHDRRRHAHLR